MSWFEPETSPQRWGDCWYGQNDSLRHPRSLRRAGSQAKAERSLAQARNEFKWIKEILTITPRGARIWVIRGRIAVAPNTISYRGSNSDVIDILPEPLRQIQLASAYQLNQER